MWLMNKELDESIREETPRLSFNSHEDALDFVDKCVEESDRWMYTHSLNFVKRYLNGDMNIVLRADINGTNSVCDFVLSCIPMRRGHSKWSRDGRWPSEHDRIGNSRNRGYHCVFLAVGDNIQGPQE